MSYDAVEFLRGLFANAPATAGAADIAPDPIAELPEATGHTQGGDAPDDDLLSAPEDDVLDARSTGLLFLVGTLRRWSGLQEERTRRLLRPLVGFPFAAQHTKQPPPEILADPTTICCACGEGRVLPAVPGAERGLCYGCWLASLVRTP